MVKTVLLRNQGIGEFQPVLIEGGLETEEGILFRPTFPPTGIEPYPQSHLLTRAMEWSKSHWGDTCRFLIGNTLSQAHAYQIANSDLSSVQSVAQKL